ncbi:MAG: tRNA preQ1(34) S-adenosylmethionine ribosyltransferase-isomerase QueA [Deltaproteobacteria bacterium]|jgi:S-adenosylmethionine:tRNA ribosyltransferase-isomerase|nr:tRNA preQ1(34) S-adenosylmethionine ribosyltransferase-isomerase QueA [Deltaproteobacteria bacterium]
MQNNSKNFAPQAAVAAISQDDPAAIPEDFRLSSYFFDLPEELIAQYPSAERGGSRLYLLRNRRNETDKIIAFNQLAEALPPNCLFVANNSRVLPARLPGRLPSGGKFEFLLLSPLPLFEATAKTTEGWQQAEVEALLRPSKKFRIGDTYALGNVTEIADAEALTVPGDTDAPGSDPEAPAKATLCFTLLEKGEFGQCRALLRWRGNLLEQVNHLGSLPLPPYIRRQAEAMDNERYQTIFSKADKCGSVAAPTAGLHFTPEIRDTLIAAGHDWTELTLFVGYGTFSPVREADIRAHRMHAEYVEIPEDTVKKILEAKAEGRPVIAVGTTSARSLEGLAELLAGQENILTPWRGPLNCFIHPGKELRVIDGLLTNFHLPESTLLMLVSALCGRKRLLTAYEQAVKEKMRFFSYGDAMLIL